MKALERTIGILNTLLIILAGVALLAVMVIACLNVVFQAMHVRFIGAAEMVGFAGAIVVAAALGQTQVSKDHVPVDIITRHFPPLVNRIIDLFKYSLKLAFAGMVAWYMFRYALDIRGNGEVSETLKIAYWPFMICVAVGFAMLACAVTLDIIRTFMPEPPVSAPVAAEQAVEEEVPLP